MNRYFLNLLTLIMISSVAFAQTKNFIDQPYLETAAKADTLITPDRIYISIVLNEADSKNKKSTEELESLLFRTLEALNIDTGKNLRLLDYSSDFKKYFIKGQNILKIKNYSLLVYDAATAGTVLTELEKVGISNVDIQKVEHSKADQLLLELRGVAVKRAKRNAERMAFSLNQSVGKAIYITDNFNNSIVNTLQGQVSGVVIRGASSMYGNRASEPMLVEFQKVKFEVTVNVSFVLQ